MLFLTSVYQGFHSSPAPFYSEKHLQVNFVFSAGKEVFRIGGGGKQPWLFMGPEAVVGAIVGKE